MEHAVEHGSQARPATERWSSPAEELDDRIRGYGMLVLGDRSLPRSGRVDRIAIGPGGITLIDLTSFDGRARIESGRLISSGRDRTAAVDALLTARSEIEAILASREEGVLRIKAALCWPDVEGAAQFGSLTLKGVRLDNPRGIVRLARRSGEIGPAGVAPLAAMLERSLASSPPATH